MTQLPLLSAKEIIRALERLGYSAVRQRGSHIRLTAPGKNPVTVPNYKLIDRSLLKRILRDASLSAEKFEALLH